MGLKHWSRVRFIDDVLTWNGKSRKAKKGDTGNVFGDEDHNGKVSVRRHNSPYMTHGIPADKLEVID